MAYNLSVTIPQGVASKLARRACKVCPVIFQPRRKDHEFCSGKCRQREYVATMFQRIREKKRKRKKT